MTYHHIGIPTSRKRENEIHLPHLKMYVSGYGTSPYGVEWMRFEEDADFPDLVKRVPHVAFEVPDIETAIEGAKVLIEPNSPSPGVVVAFIEDNGAPAYAGPDPSSSACSAMLPRDRTGRRATLRLRSPKAANVVRGYQWYRSL